MNTGEKARRGENLERCVTSDGREASPSQTARDERDIRESESFLPSFQLGLVLWR